MKIIENSVMEYHQEPGMDGIYKACRDAAFICYQTDVNTTKRTPKEFVENVLLKNGHTRPLEFATVYLFLPYYNNIGDKEREHMDEMIFGYEKNPYSRVYKNFYTNEAGDVYGHNYYITTNFRVIMEGDYESGEDAWKDGYKRNYMDDLRYMCEPMDNHEIRRTFTMDISRGCSDDFRTHITMSSIAESTRWCNFSKGKYGSELTFIKPYWFGENKWKDGLFKFGMWIEERIYMTLAKWFKLEAQQLKRVFPLAGKTELRLCGYEDSWENFFWRRCDKHADPECVMVAEMIKKEMFKMKL